MISAIISFRPYPILRDISVEEPGGRIPDVPTQAVLISKRSASDLLLADLISPEPMVTDSIPATP